MGNEFKVNTGIEIKGGIKILSGQQIPVATAPNGSVYYRTNGDKYNMISSQWVLSVDSDPRPSDLIIGTITINANKHHIVMNDLEIDGDLVIDGEVGVI